MEFGHSLNVDSFQVWVEIVVVRQGNSTRRVRGRLLLLREEAPTRYSKYVFCGFTGRRSPQGNMSNKSYVCVLFFRLHERVFCGSAVFLGRLHFCNCVFFSRALRPVLLLYFEMGDRCWHSIQSVDVAVALCFVYCVNATKQGGVLEWFRSDRCFCFDVGGFFVHTEEST